MLERNSSTATNSWESGQRINFDNCEIIDKGNLNLEFWHTEPILKTQIKF